LRRGSHATNKRRSTAHGSDNCRRTRDSRVLYDDWQSKREAAGGSEDSLFFFLFLSLSYPYFRKPKIVRKEYNRFYPSGKLHVVRIVLQIIGLGLAVAAAKQFSYWWR
jgi:hypothetical protein